MKPALLTLRTIAPQAKLSSRNREQHIRIGKLTEEQFLRLQSKIKSSSKDRRFSSSYLTHIIEGAPVVLSHSAFKTNGDKILQKQLTPTKLGIVGSYDDLATLVNKVKEQTANFSNIRKLLDSLIDNVAYDITLPNDVLADYKINKRSLDKDFGEILAGIHLLKINGNVSFPEDEATAFFDLISNGVKYNVKSGNGSGQSFKSLSLSGTFKDNEAIAFEMIQAMCATGSGKERIYNMIETATRYRGTLGKVLSELSPQNTKDAFVGHLCALQNKYDLGSIGVPNLDGEYLSENAYLFSACTLISQLLPEEVATSVLSSLQPPVKIIHIRSKASIYFDIPTEIRYRFHYWGNYRSITNNLPGFKSIY